MATKRVNDAMVMQLASQLTDQQICREAVLLSIPKQRMNVERAEQALGRKMNIFRATLALGASRDFPESINRQFAVDTLFNGVELLRPKRNR
jgi:hypothetical protein